ncbi:hypothetical protein J7K25_00800 [bacterium]|nr:hypothetical protein [bacterium]
MIERILNELKEISQTEKVWETGRKWEEILKSKGFQIIETYRKRNEYHIKFRLKLKLAETIETDFFLLVVPTPRPVDFVFSKRQFQDDVVEATSRIFEKELGFTRFENSNTCEECGKFYWIQGELQKEDNGLRIIIFSYSNSNLKLQEHEKCFCEDC